MPEPKPVGWVSIVTIYLYTVFSMAPAGVVASLTLDFGQAMHVSPKEVGLAIAMFSLPSALFAAVGGSIIDRFGAKPAMIVSALICIAGDAVAFAAPSTLVLNIALLLSGLGFAGISVAGPAMIVTTLTGPRQVKAMSLWSTYAPTGFALGLLLAAPFAGTPLWGVPLGLHAALTAAAVACGFLLPGQAIVARAATSFRQRVKELGEVCTDIAVLRLAVAVALPAAISYGTSLVAPTYLARVHEVSIGASSTTVALAKAVAMILVGLVMGQLLSRKVNLLTLFAALCAVGLGAQFAVFYPDDSFAVAAGGLIVWLFVYGAAAALGMSMLSKVIRNPANSGAASGLIGQFISIASFMTPSVYFGMQGWIGFVVVAGVGLAISLIALPAWKRRTPVAAEAAPGAAL